MKIAYKKTCKSICSIFERSPKTDYFLKSKTENLPIKQFPTDSWLVPAGAVEYSILKIGRKSNPRYEQEVTTFYDSNKRSVEKCFAKPFVDKYKIRKYTYSQGKTLNGASIAVRNIQESVYTGMEHNMKGYKRDNKLIALFGKWKVLSDEMQCVSSVYGGKAKKLSTLKRVYTPESKQIFLTEYQANHKCESPDKKKMLSADILEDNHLLSIHNMKFSQGLSLKEDEFLPYRFITNEDKCKTLPHYFLNKHNLNGMGIQVFAPSNKVNDLALAHFSTYDRAIHWKYIPETSSIVGTSAHEAEHAYQHALMGRYRKESQNAYESDCAYKFGKIINKQERKEAIKYIKADNEYPSLGDDHYIQKHDENYLEIKANFAGRKAQKMYQKGQHALKNMFPFFPDSKNMF